MSPGGLSRRQFLAAGLGVVGAAATATGLGGYVLPLLAREDLIPGRAPEISLEARAWTDGPDRLTFAALGDNGSGGRQAMAVATRMAETYRTAPFGNVFLLGDISYYGNFADRYDDVFVAPMTPLLDAGVTFDLAIGNHDRALRLSDAGLRGDRGRDPADRHPRPLLPPRLRAGRRFLPRLERAGAVRRPSRPSSSSGWTTRSPRPPGSGASSRCTTRRTRRAATVRPRGRTSGSCRSSSVTTSTSCWPATTTTTSGPCRWTASRTSSAEGAARPRRWATATSPRSLGAILEFLHVDIDDDRLVATCVQPAGQVADRFELRAREGR